MLVAGVFLTWIVFTAIAIILGLWVTLFLKAHNHFERARLALWFGLGQVFLLLILINFFSPLGSALAVVIVLLLSLASLGVWIGRKGWKKAKKNKTSLGKGALWLLVPLALIALTLVLFAHSFAGPLENWDTGLYQLNAIQYAAEYRVIPGLANMHERFGTNTTASLLPAILAATPWGIEAFRLLVGLFLFIFSVDLTLRLLGSDRSKPQPGLILMLLSALGFLPFLLGDPAGWVTGPTPDTISMILVVVASAYLLDAFWKRSLLWSTVAGLVAVMAATVRTQLWVFAFAVAVVAVIHAWRSPNRNRSWRTSRPIVLIGLGLSLLLGIGMAVRDYFLSGWLLFPATAFPLPVDWRVPDPAASREWIMSWAREPASTPETVVNSWSWLWPWVGRNLSDWSIQILIGSLAAAFLIWVALRTHTSNRPHAIPSRIGFKGLALLTIPALASLVVWFFAAPDPRFAWGTLLTLGLIPLTLALIAVGNRLPAAFKGDSSHGNSAMLVGVSALMTFAIAGPALSGLVNMGGYVKEGFETRIYSFGSISIAVNVNPVETPAIAEFQLDDGNVILTPTQDDRCQLAFPACRPYPDPTMQFRGDSVQDGFRSPRTVNN